MVLGYVLSLYLPFDYPKAVSSPLVKAKMVSMILSGTELRSFDFQLRFPSTLSLCSPAASDRQEGRCFHCLIHRLLPKSKDLLWVKLLELLTEDGYDVAKESEQGYSQNSGLTVSWSCQKRAYARPENHKIRFPGSKLACYRNIDFYEAPEST